MLNKFPLWKNVVVLLVLLLSALYAAPNLYPDSPALQIYAIEGEIDQRVLDRSTRALEQAGIEFQSAAIEESNALIRFTSEERQIRAKTRLEELLGQGYIVALNLAPNTPDFLASLGAQPMKLGLDLRGGVHFLMEVDMEVALERRLNVYAGEMRTKLREERIRYRLIEVLPDSRISLRFNDSETRTAAERLLRSDYNEFQYQSRTEGEDYYLEVALIETVVQEIESYAIQQNLTTLRNRVNELGVSEPLVQRQGANRIVVQLPGIQDSALAKKILGATANLEFRLEAVPNAPRAQTEVYDFRSSSAGRSSAVVEKDIIITGESVSNAGASFDENGLPQVNITLDSTGGRLMNRVTRNAVGRNMAVLFIEYKTRLVDQLVDGEMQQVDERYVEKGIISLATIQTALGNQFRITGLDSSRESSELALLLRAGSLAAPIYFVEERTVGPSLGQENINLGVKSVQIGLLLVLVFMLIYYRVFGLLANIALALNLVMMIAVMSILSATLTLPGIAGIVLTVGMAVDANVLIFSRIREELNNGTPIQSAIHAGFERAFETIFDANVTTFLVAVILFAIGTGPVQGFAVTLMIGITTSMFTAIWVTRSMVNLVYGGRNVKKLWI